MKTISAMICLASSMLAFNAAAQGRFSEIYNEEAKYIKRSSDAWREGGRVIGEIKNTPSTFTIAFKQVSTGKVVYTYKHPARLLIYQTDRVPPGTYDLIFDAEGYLAHTVRNVKIMARTDCLININFGTRVYDNR